MRPNLPLVLALAAPAAIAAPVPSLFGDILATLAGAVTDVTTTVTTAAQASSVLAKAVKKLGTTLQTNANIAGSKLGCNDLSIPQTGGHLGSIKHGISWPFQKKSFVNWRTYKSNGVNLGAWLEIEQNYDVDWWSANVGSFPDEWVSTPRRAL